MGIAGRLWRVETRVIPPSGRLFRFQKSTLFLKDPRADGSERGGPGLPVAGDRTDAGEPARPNYRGMRGSSKNIPASRGHPVSPVDEPQIQPAHPSRPKPRDMNRGALFVRAM